MIIYSKVPFFDFNPIDEIVVNTSNLIEKVRNLQNNIINELYKPIINTNYIKECQIEINETISEIIELSN